MRNDLGQRSKVEGRKSLFKNESGQTALGYILTIAVLALAMGAILYSPVMRDAISDFYENVATRIVKAGK